jgi:nucleoside-diphosphate-sugar epimerase
MRHGVQRIVHISSFAALLPARQRPLTPDTEPGRGGAPYSRSKADQERVARRLQQDGVPIIIVQPGAVFGPGDPHFGESDQLVHAVLTGNLPIVPAGGIPIVDVRDLGECLARAIDLPPAPRRYLLGGTFTLVREIVTLLAQLTQRPLSARILPESLILPLASVVETAARLVGTKPPIAREAPWITRQRATTDDTRAQRDLGFRARDLRETLAETVRSLFAAGRISREQAGTLAASSPAISA